MTDSTTDGARTATGRDDVPALSDSSCVEFITGFPCTVFKCRGRLIRGAHSGRIAVVCSACEHVYYLVEDE